VSSIKSKKFPLFYDTGMYITVFTKPTADLVNRQVKNMKTSMKNMKILLVAGK